MKKKLSTKSKEKIIIKIILSFGINQALVFVGILVWNGKLIKI